MISKGYILVYNTSIYGESSQTFLVFSENRDELKEIENEKNAEIMRLRERFTDTESFRNIYMDHYHEVRRNNSIGDSSYLDSDQLKKFLEVFPIPEELDGLIHDVYAEEDGTTIGMIEEINQDELFSYFSIRELAGL